MKPCKPELSADPPTAMKFFDPAAATRSETSLVRAAALTFIGATAIVALYFGREVLIPVAIAVLFAFILGPAVTWVRRLLPLPFAVAAVVLGALVVAGLLAMLVTTQLAEVAGSLTGYQANLQQKIQDIRALSEGGVCLSPSRARTAKSSTWPGFSEVGREPLPRPS